MNLRVDAQTVATAFQTHYALIVAAASRYAPTTDMVYDVVNQSYIDFMNAAMEGRWTPQSNTGPFLYEIAKRRAVDLWREKKKNTTEVRKKIGEKLLDMQKSQSEDFEASNERIGALDDCLRQLSTKSRKLIEQHYMQKISFEKIAQDMVVSSNSLRKTIFRIRVKLRDCISKKLNDV